MFLQQFQLLTIIKTLPSHLFLEFCRFVDTMLFDTLEAKLSTLHQSIASIQTLISRLSNLHFQPGSVPLSSNSSTSVSAELSTELQCSLRSIRDDLEVCEQEVQDLVTGRDEQLLARKGIMEGAVRRLWNDIRVCTAGFRRAQLAAKTSLEEAQRLERELLVGTYTQSVRDDENPQTTVMAGRHTHREKASKPVMSAADKELQASSNVTLSLRRTHALLSGEVSRSQYAHEMLAESTAALGELSGNYADLDGMLKTSRGYLRSLMISQKSDSWYLTTAFWILAITCVWLFFRRLIYGPLMAGIFLFIKLPFRLIRTTGLLEGGPSSYKSITRDTSLILESSHIPIMSSYLSIAMPQSQMGGQADHDRTTSMIEEVGKVIDTKQDSIERLLGEKESTTDGLIDHPANPKKRMWEEAVDAPITEEPVASKEHTKDEL